MNRSWNAKSANKKLLFNLALLALFFALFAFPIPTAG